MKIEDSPVHPVAGKHEQLRKSMTHANKKSVERLERRSVKVSKCESKSSTSLVVKEVSAERSAGQAVRTSQSCNQENTAVHQLAEEFKSEGEYSKACKLQDSEDTAVEELAIREHFENLDTCHVSDFWDQVCSKTEKIRKSKLEAHWPLMKHFESCFFL